MERSTVLPDTYLAPGLLIRNGLVDGRHLEHLGWGAVADLESAGLGSRIPRRGSRKQPFSPAATDGSSRGDNGFAPQLRFVFHRIAALAAGTAVKSASQSMKVHHERFNQ